MYDYISGMILPQISLVSCRWTMTTLLPASAILPRPCQSFKICMQQSDPICCCCCCHCRCRCCCRCWCWCRNSDCNSNRETVQCHASFPELSICWTCWSTDSQERQRDREKESYWEREISSLWSGCLSLRWVAKKNSRRRYPKYPISNIFLVTAFQSIHPNNWRQQQQWQR